MCWLLKLLVFVADVYIDVDLYNTYVFHSVWFVVAGLCGVACVCAS